MCSLSKMASETYGGTPACALFLIMLFSPLPVYKKYRLQTNKLSGKQLWSAICFKIMTRYTRFFPTYTCNHSCYTIYVRFIPKYMTIFLQTRIYMRTKNPIYMRYKQACGIWGYRKSSYKRHRIIPSGKNPFMYDAAEK